MVLRQIFMGVVIIAFLTLPVFGWMDESFIPVWEKDYRTKGAFSGETLTNSLGMSFVKIPAGEFWMGSPSDEPGRGTWDGDNEKRHRVKISKAFYMMSTEVTQGQWERVMGKNPSNFTSCGKDCPVESVFWNEVQEFIQKLNAMDKTITVRLPTEAEWEYAARAGSETALSFGPMEILGERNAPALDAVAWYGGNSCVTYEGGSDCSGWPEKQNSCKRCGPHPVGQKQANAWGLYDMHGNVWEWVQDVYKKEYETLSGTDPIYAGAGDYRVFRGGCWLSYVRSCRSADRRRSGAGFRDSGLGFRLAGF